MDTLVRHLAENFGSTDPVSALPEEACWQTLEKTPVGRIAIAVGDDVEIFPVNFVAADRRIFFRTSPGSKLLGLTVHPSVALEIDGFDEAAAFSVVVKGRAERVEAQAEVDAAEQLPLTPWIPTLKYRWVRIVPTEVSGRVFRRGPEPDRYV